MYRWLWTTKLPIPRQVHIAVGTALDEYRAQAQDKYDDHVGAEETLELGQDGTFAEIDQRSRTVAQTAEEERKSLSDWAEPNSRKADNLGRQIQDGANIAHSVQSQIRIRPIIARWYEAAGLALRKLPDVIVKSANLLRVGTDIGQIWAEEWSAFKKRIRHLAYDQIRGLADALEATGVRLKQDRRKTRNTVERQRDPETVAAEHRVKQILLFGAQLPEDLANMCEVIAFGLREGRIKRPTDLVLLGNLRTLGLGDTRLRFEEIEALGQLSNLTSLSVPANDASDLSPLARLSNLTSLTVQARTLDLAGIRSLEKLTRLQVSNAHDVDLAPLEKLASLKKLRLANVTFRNRALLKSVEIELVGESMEI